MPLLTATNLRHAYGTQLVLDGATISIEPGEKVGLVGRNGSGKTTLMKILLGALTPDTGAVQFQRGAKVGYLSQDPSFEPDATVRDAAEEAFAQLHDLHRQAHAVYEQMALTADEQELHRLLNQQARIDSEIEAAGGYAIDHQIDATLHGLGFADEQLSLPVAALSGGQKGRLGLARLLLEAPDMLLLDEPTNHLDIAGRQWLEDFLGEEFPGAVLLVSHDRWLLDRVVSRIIEVERGVIREYPGTYHKYVELRRERQLTEARVYDKQIDHIRREKQFIQRYKAGQRAKQARGRQSRLERFAETQLVERPAELEIMRLKLPKPSRVGDQVIIAEGVAKRFDDLILFENLDLSISRGDRIGVIGPNGAGKTTLIRCLLGELPLSEGQVRQGSRLSTGYYRQLHDNIDFSLTIWQYLQSVIVSLDGQAKASEQQARDLAGAFLFSGDEQDKRLADVSGGERSRAVLAGLVAGAHNLLVLDEPTNHLDIPSAERLEEALNAETGYEGTVILITHDRALLQSTCNKLIIFDGQGQVRWFEGTYRDWLARQAKETRAAPSARSVHPPPAPARPAARPKAPANPIDHLQRLSIAQLEERVELIEKEIASLDAQLLDPEVYRDGARCRVLRERREELGLELEPLEDEWSRRAADA